MKIKRKSILFELADFGGLKVRRDRTTLCALIWNALKGAVGMAIIIFFAAVIVAMFGAITIIPAIALYFKLVHGLEFNALASALSTILALFTIGTAWNLGFFKWVGNKLLSWFSGDPRNKHDYTPKEPGIVVTTYRAIKQRVCPIIDVES